MNGICNITAEVTKITHSSLALGFCDRASWANCEVREKTNKMQQLDVYYQYFLNMFWASTPPTLLHDPASRTVTFIVLAPHKAVPHNRYQPHPAEPGM